MAQNEPLRTGGAAGIHVMEFLSVNVDLKFIAASSELYFDLFCQNLLGLRKNPFGMGVSGGAQLVMEKIHA